jgi:hypothetical protein
MKHILKDIQHYSKDKSPESYDSSYTCILKQFSLEKTDECNKHQDLSVH